jgi:hypothetical protein
MNQLSRNLFITTAIVSLFSSNVFARSSTTDRHGIDYKGIAVSCQYPTLMDGWYMGAQIGYGPYRVRNRIDTPGTPEIISNLVASANGWAAGVAAGYGKMINPWFYLGGELFIDANNFDQNFVFSTGPTTSAYTNKTGNGPIYGIGLLPGIKLTPSTLTYARLGWNRVEIKTFEEVTDCDCSINNVSKTMGGFVFGIGIETLITSNYSVRGEFDHMYVNSYNTTSIYDTEVSASSNQYMLTFIYHAGV